MQRVDPAVEAYTARLAGEHQRVVLPGLTDERLQLIAERLESEREPDASVQARLAVVRQELRNRGIAVT